MKNIIIFSLISINFIFSINAFSQEKKSPDIFNGFRDFKFYTPITDYYNYNYKKISKKDYCKRYADWYAGNTSSAYEIVLPYSEAKFLGTIIEKIQFLQYENKIIEIILVLENDISEILSNMFLNASGVYTGYPLYTSGFYQRDHKFVFCEKCPDFIYDTVRGGVETYSGKNTILEYNSVYIDRYMREKPLYGKQSPTYEIENRSYTATHYLTFFANNYKDKIDSKKTQIHYDSYLSDFGTENHPKKNKNKQVYSIPLFKFSNIYYVRVLFGDVLENLVFDTGASQLIISNNLYNKLNEKQLLDDLHSTKKIVLADGSIVNLKKVMIKNLQINDLEIDYLEAFVNTSSNISLMGQSVL